MSSLRRICAGLFLGTALAADESKEPKEILNLLFMADIGHSRAHAKDLTKQWPMGKSAYEGAFSLYEGMLDFVENQGAKPTAVFVVGDVAYGGGDPHVNNNTRDAFQTYLQGNVPVDRVFPVIGNHDIHYLGCSLGERLAPFTPCYYGSATQELVVAAKNITFEQWRQNWLTAFPGLNKAILPSSKQAAKDQWLAPTRYNVNLDPKSSVYFIAGLITGSERLKWQEDTPNASLDAASTGGNEIECRFLRDSLNEGRKLGKTVFIYLTHSFERTCDDWSLIKQLDVWITGHKHFYWQSREADLPTAQEVRYYPLHMLIGNGGFDEGESETVSFGHLREIPYKDARGLDRVKIHFDVYDTCISGQIHCPLLGFGGPYCWDKCMNMPGGVDGGGGSRRATPGKHGTGFTLDAPASKKAVRQQKLFGTPWRIRVETAEGARWMAIMECSEDEEVEDCLFASTSADDFVTVSLVGHGEVPEEDNFQAALVLEEDKDHPPLVDVVDGGINVLTPGNGFWDTSRGGMPKLSVKNAAQFVFVKKGKQWQIKGLKISEDDRGNDYFSYDASASMNVTFEMPPKKGVNIFV
mmetsp:Transcript_31416/g.73683  ORF Transcript_31416/g.73683 Transcript_31416/m.73683 type:complete len:581 (-) Transcript_31416:98-1840(-)